MGNLSILWLWNKIPSGLCLAMCLLTLDKKGIFFLNDTSDCQLTIRESPFRKLSWSCNNSFTGPPNPGHYASSSQPHKDSRGQNNERTDIIGVLCRELNHWETSTSPPPHTHTPKTYAPQCLYLCEKGGQVLERGLAGDHRRLLHLELPGYAEWEGRGPRLLHSHLARVKRSSNPF